MNYQTEMKLKRIKNMPLMVWGLLAIQIIVFLSMTLAGMSRGLGFNGSLNGEILVAHGAMLKGFVTHAHEYWRFITPIFVHIGFMHLIVNSLTLYFIGTQLEAMLGHWRFLAVYLLTGVAGNVLSFAFGNANSISAGASTSLFGLFGIFVALGRVYPHHPMIQFMSQRMLTLIVLNLVMNLFSSGIDILGHVGGALGGFLLGFVISIPALKDTHYESSAHDVHRRIRFGLIFVFFIVFCLLYGFRDVLGF
ncbi:rhomboid family intramembrane serine protease [Vagococcus sp. BWB3-3]|uniref:Rhomboid family intramembrane serine protease n=1 Tax=Vagococcus allomyrinae TaxID=2794353 RepID=A0A940PGW6_9ENTE|nr:rhomboid family intramembrane serine protease [Vagococcus allomyrinae]MBP1043728.1 rhomboid family intramembrane serine protease [Vagococcus allomyrinae]